MDKYEEAYKALKESNASPELVECYKDLLDLREHVQSRVTFHGVGKATINDNVISSMWPHKDYQEFYNILLKTKNSNSTEGEEK